MTQRYALKVKLVFNLTDKDHYLEFHCLQSDNTFYIDKINIIFIVQNNHYLIRNTTTYRLTEIGNIKYK